MDEYRGTPNIKRGGSLDLSLDIQDPEIQSQINQIRAKAKDDKKMLVDKLTGVEVPAARLEEIKKFAAMLHKKYPNWKPGRIASHTANFFRLKLKK